MFQTFKNTFRKFALVFGGNDKPYWIMPQDSRIQYAGIPVASFVNDVEFSTGITCISGEPQHGVRQYGYIRRITVNVTVAGTGIKFKLFRKNGAAYDFVSETQTFVVSSPGTITFDLTAPMACIPGDIVGYYISGGVKVGAKAGGLTRYVVADVIGSSAFGTTSANTSNLIALGISPYLVVTGDSIAEGYPGYESFYDTGPTGFTPTNDPATILRNLINGSQIGGFETQNHGDGGRTFSWIVTTGIVSALATLPGAVLIQCGVNDVNTGRSWAQVEANLDSIRSLVPATTRLYIREILPWTNGDDAQAATIRTWNASIATWCASNNATLIVCHDAMGQVRISTGEIDDLLAAYDQDGVHLNLAGYTALAAIDNQYI